MDAFFAAVELLRHPELKGKPVVIGGRGDPTRRGVAATASYEARRFGVYSAMPLRTALKLCPQAVFLPVDYDEYKRVSAIVKRALSEVSPLIQDVGIDEAYLDATGLPGSAQDIAAAIKRSVRAASGLTCSVGIAPNKLLAKIASDLDKPDGLTLIEPEDLPARIWPLAVRKIPGIGPKSEARLKAAGIATIGELAAQPPAALIERFGRSYGEFLHRAAHGIDERPVLLEREPKSRSRETTFQNDVDDWQELARTLARLARSVADDLARRQLRGRNIGVKLRFADFATHTRALTLREPTASYERIRKAAFECLGRIALDRPVRLIGVRVGEFGGTEPQPTPDLFD